MMNPDSRLYRGLNAAAEGRFDDALRDYIWYHHNALRIAPSCRGVRSSFALAWWSDLAAKYPPARVALVAIRDEKLRRVQGGQEKYELFNDVCDICSHLDENDVSYRAYVSLRREDPHMAEQCGAKVFDALVQSGDYELAREALTNPESKVRSVAENMFSAMVRSADDPDRRPSDRGLERQAAIHVLAKKVSCVLLVLREVGEGREAERLRNLVLEIASGQGARAELDAELP